MKYGVSENSFEKFFGTKAKGIVLQLRVLGEMIIVTDRTGLKSINFKTEARHACG